MDLLTACARCGAVPYVNLDMGRMGKIGLCTVCWVGLAGCMARDYSLFNNFNVDFHAEMAKAGERENLMRMVVGKKVHE
jgi:hypothetical protein